MLFATAASPTTCPTSCAKPASSTSRPAGSAFGPDYVASSLKNASGLLGHGGVVASAVEHLQCKEGVPSSEEAKKIADGAMEEAQRVGAVWRTSLVVGKKPE